MSDAKQWAVIGAGPAGIAALGAILDKGVSAQDVAWIDPHFAAGDFGQLWSGVTSNTKAGLFTRFLHQCDSYGYGTAPDFSLAHLDPEKTCYLGDMREPLLWVTEQLRNRCQAIQTKAQRITNHAQGWEIHLDKGDTIVSKNVVLALGADEKTLSYPDVKVMSLQQVLNENTVQDHFSPEDTVAVFGSSHSAIIALRHLTEMSVKQVINFYQSPLKFAVYMDDWILFDNTGLKGNTAVWAREHLNGNEPDNLLRVFSNKENIAHHLPLCNKAVYCVGFASRTIPVEGVPVVEHDPHTGIIAPGLFGVGIGFPELKTDPYGHQEHSVGLWKFMDYLHRVLPLWMRYTR